MTANDLRGILCWLLRGHKWRRLHKSEGLPSGYAPAQIRICNRCLTERIVKQRKPKEQSA